MVSNSAYLYRFFMRISRVDMMNTTMNIVHSHPFPTSSMIDRTYELTSSLNQQCISPCEQSHYYVCNLHQNFAQVRFEIFQWQAQFNTINTKQLYFGSKIQASYFSAVITLINQILQFKFEGYCLAIQKQDYYWLLASK